MPLSCISGFQSILRGTNLGPLGKQASGMATKLWKHTFTLWAIIEEARQQYSKALCCFVVVDFQKAFNSVLRALLLQRLRNIGVLQSLIVSTMRLYDTIVGRLHTQQGLSDFIRNTIGVK